MDDDEMMKKKKKKKEEHAPTVPKEKTVQPPFLLAQEGRLNFSPQHRDSYQ